MGTNTQYYVLMVTVCAIKEMRNKLYEQANGKHLQDFNFIGIGKFFSSKYQISQWPKFYWMVQNPQFKHQFQPFWGILGVYYFIMLTRMINFGDNSIIFGKFVHRILHIGIILQNCLFSETFYPNMFSRKYLWHLCDDTLQLCPQLPPLQKPHSLSDCTHKRMVIAILEFSPYW